MSLVVKRPPRLNIFVTNTADEPFSTMKSAVDLINVLMNETVAHDMSEVVNKTYARSLYNDPLNFDFAGYVLTDLVLEHIMRLRDPTQRQLCNFIVVTNGDNLYLGDFFPALASMAASGHRLIGVHFTSHYEWPGPIPRGACMAGRKGRDAEIFPAFEVGCADLGAVAFSSKLAGGDRFLVTELGRARADRDRVVRADGLFFQRLAGKPGANPVIVPRVLMIHQ